MPKFSGVNASLITAFNGRSFVSSGGAYDPIAGTGTFTTTIYDTGILKFGGIDLGSLPGNVVGASPAILFSSDPDGQYMVAQETTVGTGWVKFAMNNNTIAAINSSGELWGTGNSSLYFPGAENLSTWSQVTGQGHSDTGWTDISYGQGHALAINSGRLYYIGREDFAGAGSSGYTYYNWTQIGTDTDWEAVSCNYQHSLAIKNGVLYAAGNNGNGRTGVGLTSGTTNSLTACTATNMVGATNNNFTFIWTGFDMSIAIQSGRAFFFGDLDSQEAAGMDLTVDQSVPVQIGQVNGTLQTNWSRGTVSPFSSFLINTSGELYFAGEAGQNIRGDGTTTDAKNANHVKIGSDTNWEDVQFSVPDFYGSSVVFKKGGVLYYAGRNIYGGVLNSGSININPMEKINGDVNCSAFLYKNDNSMNKNQVIGGFYT